MLTILYAFAFSLFAFIYPMKAWKVIVFISVGGILGMLGETIGLKPWVSWTVQFWFGFLGIMTLMRQKTADPFRFRFGILLFLTGIWLYIYGLITDFTLIPFWTSFQGGFMALFILAHMGERTIWKGITLIIGVHLLLSVAVYYLQPAYPVLSMLDGVYYNDKGTEFLTYTGEFARGIINAGQGVRGGGLYFNSNAWAQVSGWGMLVGSAIFLVGDRNRLKLFGILLMVLGILGLLGSVSRSGIFAALISVPLLFLTHLIKRNPLARLFILTVVIAAGYFLIRYAIGLSKVTDLEIISSEGSDYRIMNFYLVWQNFNEFIIGGRQGLGHPYDPHDIFATSIYNFGLLGFIVIISSTIGGLILVWQWSVKGEKFIRPLLGMPKEYEAIASLVAAPLFIFYLVSSIGNGVAGGLPYTNLYFILGYMGWRLTRRRRIKLSHSSSMVKRNEDHYPSSPEIVNNPNY